MEPVRESFWNMPQPWTQILLYVALAVALAVLGYGLYRRIRLWKQGQPSLRFDHLGRRLGNVAKYVLAQAKVANEAYPGLMHVAIFAGFVILFIGTALIFVNDDFFHLLFGIQYIRGGFYLFLETALDIFGLFLVLGIILALVRRYLIRPARLENRPDDAITLGLLAFLGVGGFVQEGLRVALDPPGGTASFIGDALGGLFVALGANSAGGVVAYQILWWVHALAALAFIALIPYTRLFHLITNPLNAFFYPLTTPAALAAIEGIEECEILGSAQLAHLPQKRLLDYESCTRCGRCQDVCPAYLAGQPLSPRQVILDLDSFLLQRGKAPLLGARGKQFPAEGEVELPGGVIAEETLWACTTCMACMERCPVLIDHIGTIVELRRYLSLCSGQMPASVRGALDKTQRAGNPYGTRGGRLNWAEGLAVPVIGEVEDAEVLLWVGCAGAYDPRNSKVLRAVATLLQKAGVRFGVLGDEEQCCGDWARRVGEEYLFQTLALANIATLQQYKFQTIVTACPHGFNTLRNEYRQFGGEFTVQHHSVYIAKLIAAGRLRPVKGWDRGVVAYHDPCYLGRYNGILAEPRQALRAVPGLQVVEAAHRGQQGLCCGGGGGKMWMEEEADKRVNQVRLRELEATGAGAIGVACPYCLSMLDDAVKVKGLEEKVAVLDVAEIVAGAL